MSQNTTKQQLAWIRFNTTGSISESLRLLHFVVWLWSGSDGVTDEMMSSHLINEVRHARLLSYRVSEECNGQGHQPGMTAPFPACTGTDAVIITDNIDKLLELSPASFNLRVVDCWFRLDHSGVSRVLPTLLLNSCLRAELPSQVLCWHLLFSRRTATTLFYVVDPCHTLQIRPLIHGGRSRNYCRAKRCLIILSHSSIVNELIAVVLSVLPCKIHTMAWFGLLRKMSRILFNQVELQHNSGIKIIVYRKIRQIDTTGVISYKSMLLFSKLLTE